MPDVRQSVTRARRSRPPWRGCAAAFWTWRCSIIRPSTVTTPRPAACASSKAAITRREKSISSARRRPHVVGRRDLAGMHQRLAVEPHRLSLARLGEESLGVADVVVHAVEDHLAGLAGAEQRHRQRRQQRRALGQHAGPQLLGEVVVAHHEHADAIVGGDRADVEDRGRRLDHRPDRHLVRSAGGGQLQRDLVEVVARVDLRDHDRRRARLGGGGEVGRAPLRVEPVAADRRPRAVRRRPSLAAATALARATSLASGATASSRSKISASAGIVLAFSRARSLAAGM